MVEDYGWQENRSRANEWGDGYVSPAEMVKDYGWEYNNQADQDNYWSAANSR